VEPGVRILGRVYARLIRWSQQHKVEPVAGSKKHDKVEPGARNKKQETRSKKQEARREKPGEANTCGEVSTMESG
jgi:hypothetical protein